MIDPRLLDAGVAAIIGAAARADHLAPEQSKEEQKPPMSPAEEAARARLRSYPDRVRAQLKAVADRHGNNRKGRRAVAAICRHADRRVARTNAIKLARWERKLANAPRMEPAEAVGVVSDVHAGEATDGRPSV